MAKEVIGTLQKSDTDFEIYYREIGSNEQQTMNKSGIVSEFRPDGVIYKQTADSFAKNFFDINLDEDDIGIKSSKDDTSGEHGRRAMWDKAYAALYQKLVNDGIDFNLLAKLQEFLDRLDKMLPDNVQDLEFVRNSVIFKALKADTGNMIRLCQVNVYPTWFTLDWPTTAVSKAGRINIGTDSNTRDRGQKKIIYETLEEIPLDEIERFRDRIREITGYKRIGTWN